MSIYAQELEKHKWKNRILVIKSSTKENPLFLKQINEVLRDKTEIKTRKLILYVIDNSNMKIIDFSLEAPFQTKIIDVKETNSLFNITNTFEVILIGLDGGIKLQQTEFLSLEELSTLIDGMPIRQRELKNNN